MLFAEFAINPSHISSVAHLALLKTNFDFSRGALISAFPNSWYSKVFENVNQHLSDKDKARATELLQGIKSYSLVKSERDYAGSDWAEAALVAHQHSPFYCIVGALDHKPPEYLSSFEQLFTFDFEKVGSVEVLRLPSALVEPLGPLLRGSAKLRLVDPYLCPSNKYISDVINALANNRAGKKFDIEIYSAEKEAKPGYESHFYSLSSHLPPNVTLSWFLLSDDGTAKMHQRLFFTEKGGVIFDRGFIVPNPHEQRLVPTSLRTMTKSQIVSANRDYNYSQPSLDCMVRLSSIPTEIGAQ